MGAKVVILPFSTKFFKYFLPFSTKFISVICHFPPNLVGKPVFESMWVSWVRVTLGSLQYIGSPWNRGTLVRRGSEEPVPMIPQILGCIQKKSIKIWFKSCVNTALKYSAKISN